jgi:pyrroline-5-carboxylate reductase
MVSSTASVQVPKKSSATRLAVLGCGKMGTILLQAFAEHGLFSKEETVATVQHTARCEELSSQLGIPVGSDNRSAVAGAELILICVKPQAVAQVLEEVSDAIAPDALVISIAASVPISFLQQRLPAGVAVVRAMPNTPAQVGCAMTAMAAGAAVRPEQMETARKLFETVGRVVTVDEKHMDAITGLSASGPAFVFIILESLAEAGVKIGLPRDLSTTLAAQTMLGSAKLALESGLHPALLKDAVTTPAGCTIDGIMELEEGKLRVTLIKAVVKAAERAKGLQFS